MLIYSIHSLDVTKQSNSDFIAFFNLNIILNILFFHMAVFIHIKSLFTNIDLNSYICFDCSIFQLMPPPHHTPPQSSLLYFHESVLPSHQAVAFYVILFVIERCMWAQCGHPAPYQQAATGFA